MILSMASRPIFAIDIGNTNVTTALVHDREVGQVARAATVREARREVFGDTLRDLLTELGATPDRLAGVAVASVVPALTAHVRDIAAQMGLPLLVADSTTVPIPMRIERPAEVGADRLVDAYAAARRHGTPTIVIDFGTATTIEAVGSDGAYLGGAIAPGLRLGLDALAERTALLPHVTPGLPPRAIATNTVEAIQAGSVLGHRELAAGLLRLVRAELAAQERIDPASIRTVVTGGFSTTAWVQSMEGINVIDPDLLLWGLAAMWIEVGPSEGSGAAGAAETERRTPAR